MPLFPGKDWLDAFVARVNSSKAYAECAASWEGDVIFLFEAEPDRGVPDPIYAWLDLWHGKCRAARYDISCEEAERARFVIRAPYSRWKEVIRRELDPVRGRPMRFRMGASWRKRYAVPLKRSGRRSGSTAATSNSSGSPTAS